MQLDMRQLPREGRYKLLSACVTPRPIAWVTTVSSAGIRNAAPYSFFNVLGDSPPTVALGIMAHGESRPKDTASNIRATGEFVVNLVSEALGEAMNRTCVDAPPDVDELEFARVATCPCVVVAPPRIEAAPASLECRVLHAIETGPHQIAVIAEVVYAHVRDEFVLDLNRLHFDTLAMGLIARMHGAGWYSRQTDLLQMVRPDWEDQAR